MSEIGEAIAADDPPTRASGGWLDRIERLGALLAAMLPIAVALYFTGIVVTVLWVSLALPVGPGAGVAYHLP